MQKSLINTLVIFLLFEFWGYSQDVQWTLRLQSNVYLRTWKLTTKAEKTETEIFGAKVVLYESSSNKPVAQTVTDNEGKFVIEVPANGSYYILVSYPGCNTKKMTVDTRNVPEKFQKDNFKPKFTITGGFIMAKPYPGINYSTLNESLVHVQFMEGKKAFDDDKNFTERGVGICSKIYDAEWDLFMKFCDFNKKGDEALAIPDCPLAKKMYESALALIPGEFYPIQQLAKIPDCLAKLENKKKEDEQKKLKEEQEKLAKQKEAEEKAKREAEEKAKKEAEKAEKERLAKEKEEQEKLAKQKEAEEKAKREAEEKAKKEAEKAEKERLAKEKEEQEKLAKQKEAEEKAKRDAEEKAKKEAEKAEKERLAKEKAEQEKLAKQKESEEKKRKMAEEEERKKAEKERLAKEKEEAEKAKREAESKTAQQNIENVPGEPNEDPDPKKGKGKTTTYQILGSQENYRKNLARANDLFKTKRYEEAKSAYEECLKFKPDDPLSKLRIRQCDSILQLKK
jgi:DNA segregation ATPase FtsK/SpoIIIE-like protein